MSNTKNIAAIEALNLKGRTGIFREYSLVAHVLIKEANVNDWGVELILEILPTTGFWADWGETFDISASWDILTNHSGYYLSASYVSWTLVIDPDFVSNITTLAPTTLSEYELLIQFQATFMDMMHLIKHGEE